MYDGLGRRRIERDYAWSSGGWVRTNEVHYIYDGRLILQERDASNNVVVTYTRGRDLSGTRQGAGGIGGLLARTDANSTSFYHADGSGNITALVNGSQTIVARYLYNPFGQIEGKWGPLADANVMQFSSMPRHNLSGLSLYAYRAYDPTLQRWLNRDPMQEAGGINLYGFVGNDPQNSVDPLGLQMPVCPAGPDLGLAEVPGATTPAEVAAANANTAAELAEGAETIGAGEAVGMASGAIVGSATLGTMPTLGILGPGRDAEAQPNGVNSWNNASSPLPQTGFIGTNGEYRDQDGNIRDASGNLIRDKNGNGCKKLKPEAKYLGSKKHGLDWDEGPAEAKKTGIPQGQWGSQADLAYAGEKAATLPPGQGAYFPFPPGSQSVVLMPDGSTVPASQFWVRNNGTGTFHGYPLP